MKKVWTIRCNNCKIYLCQFNSWKPDHHYFTRETDSLIANHLQHKHHLEFRRIYVK